MYYLRVKLELNFLKIWAFDLAVTEIKPLNLVITVSVNLEFFSPSFNASSSWLHNDKVTSITSSYIFIASLVEVFSPNDNLYRFEIL